MTAKKKSVSAEVAAKPSPKPSPKGCRFCSALNSSVDVSQVAVSGDGGLTVGGEPLTDGELASLFAEVQQFRQTRLAKVFTSTARAHAVDIGLKKAQDYDHTMLGKAILYVADVIDSTMRAVENANARAVERTRPPDVAPVKK